MSYQFLGTPSIGYSPMGDIVDSCKQVAYDHKFGTDKEDVQAYAECGADAYCVSQGIPPGICGKVAGPIVGGIYDALDELFGGGGIDCSKASSFDACDPCMQINHGYPLMNDPACLAQKKEQPLLDALYVQHKICQSAQDAYDKLEFEAFQILTAKRKEFFPAEPPIQPGTQAGNNKLRGFLVTIGQMKSLYDQNSMLVYNCETANSKAYAAKNPAIAAANAKLVLEAAATVEPAMQKVVQAWGTKISDFPMMTKLHVVSARDAKTKEAGMSAVGKLAVAGGVGLGLWWLWRKYG